MAFNKKFNDTLTYVYGIIHNLPLPIEITNDLK